MQLREHAGQQGGTLSVGGKSRTAARRAGTSQAQATTALAPPLGQRHRGSSQWELSPTVPILSTTVGHFTANIQWLGITYPKNDVTSGALKQRSLLLQKDNTPIVFRRLGNSGWWPC